MSSSFSGAGSFLSVLRLSQAGFALIRADALLPREITPLAPAPVRLLAGFLRLFADRRQRGRRPGERLASVLETQGPAAIKLGQLLSTRADIFGEVFAEDLGRLRDRLAPFSLDLAKAEIARSLGRPWTALYSEIDAPIAAASLAQAHPALLHDGRKVAVKVLRPHVERAVARDVAAMRLAAGLVERFVGPAQRLEPRAFVETLARALTLELDLRLEAAAADELREIMALDGYMRAPKVVWEGVGKRVVTLEWADGVALSKPEALEQPGLDRKKLAENIVRAFLAQALDHGAFHADLHEGNLFCAAPADLVAVDFGLVGHLGVKERRYLAEILYGFLQRDYARVARVHFEAGYVGPPHSVDAFAQALRAVGEPAFGRAASEVSMGRILALLFEITDLFDMHLRPELVLLQKTMVTVEGVARRIDPESDIWDAAKPVVERWIRRELSPAATLKRGVEEALATLSALNRLAQKTAAPIEPAPDAKPEAGRRIVTILAAAALSFGVYALGAKLGLNLYASAALALGAVLSLHLTIKR